MGNSNRLRRVLEAGASIAALCVSATPAVAQTALASASDNGGQGASQDTAGTPGVQAGAKDVVITGVRKALESARQRKRNADTVIDSISATDIGAFPDKSVAEALQRVPGVSVTRFAIPTDPAHFTTEPSGVLVRGLPQVRNEFNGRDAFSANAGRSLSWGDVPAELLGGVDIYKNQTADLIEGGIAGLVNLRTRVPFDANGQLFQVGVKANWGDIGRKVTPDANVIYSNRWQTGIGEFGLMGNISYSRLKSGSQGLQSYRTEIFTGGMIPGSANVDSPFGKGTVLIPSGVNYLDDRFDRKRTGIAAAAQWRSDDHRWLATAQYIRSVYNNSMEEYGLGVGTYGTSSDPTFRFKPGDSGIPVPGGSAPDFTFGKNGWVSGGTFAQNGGWYGDQNDLGMARNSAGEAMIHSCYGWGGQPASYCPAGYDVHADTLNAGSRIQKNRNMTQDASFNLKFDPTSNLHLSLDGQYVDSTARFYDAGIGLQSFTNPKLSGLGTHPRIVSLNAPSNVSLSPGGYANPNNWAINNLADQYQDSYGHEWAFRGDGEWNVPGDSWIDTVKFGGRYADREQVVRNSDYDWNSISNNWTTGCQYLYYNLDSKPGSCTNGGTTTTFNGYPKGFYEVQKFGASYFGGTLGSFPFVPVDFLNKHGLDQFDARKLGIGTYQPICDRHAPYAPGYFGARDTLPNSCFAQHEIATISEKIKSAYIMVKFGGHDNMHLGSVKVSGNFGLRFVETKDKSSGYLVYPTITKNPATTCPKTPLVPGGLTGNLEDGLVPDQPGAVAYDAICYLSPNDVKFATGSGTATPVSSTNTLHHWLPSFNLRFDLSPNWLLRLAASRAMSRPDMGLLKDYLSIKQVLPGNTASDPLWVKDAQGNIIGVKPAYQADATNPKLKPITAWQFDVSLEHYFGNAGMFSLDLFYKSFKDYIQGGRFNTDITNNGVTQTVQVSGPANGKGAKIQGFEVAYNRFFDFLPKPLNGLGFQTNFTYLKNKGVPNANLNTFFGNASTTSAPALNTGTLEGLSKYAYNVVGLYELPNFPVSFRLAYNWRSKYLVTAIPCCNQLPTWQKAAGWLDGSIRYSVSNHFELSLEGSNLLSTKTQTLEQLTDAKSPEKKIILVNNSWFRQDRRITFGARWKM